MNPPPVVMVLQDGSQGSYNALTVPLRTLWEEVIRLKPQSSNCISRTSVRECTLQKDDRTSILLTQSVHFIADVQHFLSAGPCFRILCASCHFIGLSYTYIYIYICFCCIFLYTGDHMLLNFLAWSLDNPFYLLAISYLFRIWYIGIADGCRWVLHSHRSSQFH